MIRAKPAAEAFEAVAKLGADPGAIVAAASAYAAEWAKRPATERRFVPHAARWLADFCCVVDRVGLVLAESRHLRKDRAGDEQSALVITLKLDRVFQHHFKS
jgi:hypothetical protein